MENISSWIQTVITVGALGIVWASIRTSRSDLKKDTDEKIGGFKKEVRKDMAEFAKDLDEARAEHDDLMPIPKHTDLCQIQDLKIQRFFTKEFTSFKDEIFEVLRQLEKTIRNGRSKPGDKNK